MKLNKVVKAAASLPSPMPGTGKGKFRLKDFDPGDTGDLQTGGQTARQGGAADRRRSARRTAGHAVRAGSLVAAAGLPGHGRGRKGRRHQARHVRRQPAGLPGRVVQGAVGRRARPRLSLALQPQPARARTDRHLQSLVLRGSPRGARAPESAGEARSCRRNACKDIWEERYRDIRAYERYLDANGVIVRKFFLNVSRAEQKRRFLERIDNPEKNWKFSAADARERGYWDDYMEAYEEAIRDTSTPESPVVRRAGRQQVVHAHRGRRDHHRDARLAGPAAIPTSARRSSRSSPRCADAHEGEALIANISPDPEPQPRRVARAR